MIIEIGNKQFNDVKQALTELAFTHYPVTFKVNGKEYTFAQFSEAEAFLLSFTSNEN